VAAQAYRHPVELRPSRFILDHYHSRTLAPASPLKDSRPDQGREIYSAIIDAPNRASAERWIHALELDDVGLRFFTFSSSWAKIAFLLTHSDRPVMMAGSAAAEALDGYGLRDGSPLVWPQQPLIRFLFVKLQLRSTLPPDPASRRRPCASLPFTTIRLVEDFHLTSC
jgi:hypothetical protein